MLLNWVVYNRKARENVNYVETYSRENMGHFGKSSWTHSKNFRFLLSSQKEALVPDCIPKLLRH